MQLLAFGQEQTTSDDYYTPAWLFEDMAVRFDLDVAAPPGGVPWIPCDRFYTQADDGLSQPWKGRVWMNPPYSTPANWVQKFIDHGDGMALLPFSNGVWLHDLWQSSAAVVVFRKPFDFVGGGIPIRTALWAFGDWAIEAIGRIGKVR